MKYYTCIIKKIMCEHIFLLGDERYEVSENYIIVHLDKINRFIKRSIYSGSLRSRLECAEYPIKGEGSH